MRRFSAQKCKDEIDVKIHQRVANSGLTVHKQSTDVGNREAEKPRVNEMRADHLELLNHIARRIDNEKEQLEILSRDLEAAKIEEATTSKHNAAVESIRLKIKDAKAELESVDAIDTSRKKELEMKLEIWKSSLELFGVEEEVNHACFDLKVIVLYYFSLGECMNEWKVNCCRLNTMRKLP